MTQKTEASFALCDRLNPSCGYQLTIADGETGQVLLNTQRDPASGDQLLTARDCWRVIELYIEPEA